MLQLPSPDKVRLDWEFKAEIHKAEVQAMNQIKAAIKNGALPDQQQMKWIIGVGPYFTIKPFGPFGENDLISRGHRPNDSAEAVVAEILAELIAAAGTRQFEGDLFLLGTPEAAFALHAYLQNNSAFYDPSLPRRTPPYPSP